MIIKSYYIFAKHLIYTHKSLYFDKKKLFNGKYCITVKYYQVSFFVRNDICAIVFYKQNRNCQLKIVLFPRKIAFLTSANLYKFYKFTSDPLVKKNAIATIT